MRYRVYEAFTLIEMLVVMGILIILMVVGIAAGRFALFRASDVAHRNAADQIFEGLQGYYVDNMAYPKRVSCTYLDPTTPVTCNPALLMLPPAGPLNEYLDVGAFHGGSGATFIYFVGGDNDDQAALICVSMRGTKDVNDEMQNGAYYCTGNGFSVGEFKLHGGDTFPEIDRDLIERDDDDPLWEAFTELGSGAPNIANWEDQMWIEYPDLYE